MEYHKLDYSQQEDYEKERLSRLRSVHEVKQYFDQRRYDNPVNRHIGLRSALKVAYSISRHAKKGRPAFVKAVIELGGNVNMHKPYGLNCLFWALKHSWGPKILNLMLENGANVNERDIEGRTPLFYVKNQWHVTLLISHGADVTIQDEDGMTALDFVRETDESNGEIIDVLIGHCATLRFNDNRPLLHRSLLDDTYSWSWDIDMIVHANLAAGIEKDTVTRLYPFQLAAVRSDLDSVYSLLRRSADLL
jgi:hypothetical protein